MNPCARNRGFSLIEALVVMAILGILAAVGTPLLSDMLAGGRVRTAAEELQMSMTYARSEAIKRGIVATVTPTGGDYANGWAVASNGATLKTAAALPGIAAIPGDTITYRPDGRLQNLAQVDLRITHAIRTAVPMRCVIVETSGRPAVLRDGNGDASDGCN